VYSRAVRIVKGPPHLVEEVVLRVYWEMARKTPRLGKRATVAVWLREHTCRAAVRVLHEADRSVDRAALAREKRGVTAPDELQAAPPGLATRLSLSILLNTGRNRSFWHFLPRAFWPDWIRPVHIGAGAVCVLGVLALWNLPLHKRNPIIESPELEMTPASFGQRAGSEEGSGASPPWSTPDAKVETERKKP
ncbi:MAG TPA: hypothetical protein VHI52_00720, partial [Verrucomicrobiae bacterium]|nr:hypothetical protein [Verrucomicrobiae bacterium]